MDTLSLDTTFLFQPKKRNKNKRKGFDLSGCTVNLISSRCAFFWFQWRKRVNLTQTTLNLWSHTPTLKERETRVLWSVGCVACCAFYALLLASRTEEMDSFLSFICFWSSDFPEERKQVPVCSVTLRTPVTLFYLLQIEFMWLVPAGLRQQARKLTRPRRQRDKKLDLLMTQLINIESISSCITVETWCGTVMRLGCISL